MNNKISSITITIPKIYQLVGLFIALSPMTAFSQALENVPWTETFTYSDGEAVGGSPTSWTASRSQGSLSVLNSALMVNGGGTEGIMKSGLIDISGGPVNVSLDIVSQGDLEWNQDYVKLFYKVDGGPETLVDEEWGKQARTTINAENITGTTLELVIRAYVSYHREYYFIDNLSVTYSERGEIMENPLTNNEQGNSDNAELDHTYAKNDGPFKNPLKGWNSGWDGGNDHPESSVGFQYIPWEDFEPSDENFDLAAVENIIDNEGSKNRHLILRLYCDWHGDKSKSRCPQWMYADKGVARLQGNNGRYITDFNDAEYIVQARQAIEALAEAYDNDPRIYAVQMGVIGYWGEWHSWGSNFGGNSYDITDSTKNAILSAYSTSFSNAKIMGRYPWREPMQSAGNIGYHNDYFVVNNGHSDEFDSAVMAGNQWVDNPIGGEVPPRNNGNLNAEKSDLYGGGAGRTMIETGHYSTMKAGSYRVDAGDSDYDAYMQLHKMMGYNYQIDVARFSETVNTSEKLGVEVIGTNIGVAPMYFDWNVQFALLDHSNIPVVVNESFVDITSILPGSLFSFSNNLDLNAVTPDTYRLAVRIIQPGADTPKSETWKLDARNTYILFSNDLQVIDGAWTNNVLTGGWSVLGEVAVN